MPSQCQVNAKFEIDSWQLNATYDANAKSSKNWFGIENKGESTFIFVKLYGIYFLIWWCKNKKLTIKKRNDCKIICQKAKFNKVFLQMTNFGAYVSTKNNLACVHTIFYGNAKCQCQILRFLDSLLENMFGNELYLRTETYISLIRILFILKSSSTYRARNPCRCAAQVLLALLKFDWIQGIFMTHKSLCNCYIATYVAG